jgi:hypothetical protein
VLDHLHFLNGYGPAGIVKDVRPQPFPDLFRRLNKLEKGERRNYAGDDRRVTGAANQDWTEDGKDYRLAALPLPERAKLGRWNRIERLIEEQLGHRERPASAEAVMRAAEQVACRVVWEGLEKVAGVRAAAHEAGGTRHRKQTPGTPPVGFLCPYEAHGAIKTAYRQEIDSFASIRRIMQKYLESEGWESPLCIAVFGQPGSGKSFTVKQILGTIRPDIANHPLEFNVAEFTGVGDLATAFHKVQDQALAGEVPLVFFDEFDASLGGNDLAWLKYFLSPMQDGKFKAGESTYRIGRAIFVFAGGISKSWQEFYELRKGNAMDANDRVDASGSDREARQRIVEQFRNAKGIDFVSRLRGHLDIETINLPKGASTDERPGAMLMFRRAVLLRSLIETRLPRIIDKATRVARVDENVLRAFLNVRRYEHEARSMQAIIEMSRVSPRGRFQLSSLPARDQLKMHVNAEDFHELMRR